ncbi:MAG TPA: hypothetical protein VMN58_05035 [Acidimicrobiales bacterium]|nr:hypothetical protein [Acidimicrobiales bacterium]
MSSKHATSTDEVSRDDIERKLREIRGEVDQVGDASRSYVIAAGAVAAVVVVAIAFAWGKRKGKKKTTVVEIHRV